MGMCIAEQHPDLPAHGFSASMSQTIIVAVTVAMLESCHPVMRLLRCRPVVHDGTTHAVIKTNVNAAVSLCKGTARCAPQPQASELRARLVQSSPAATPEAVSLMHSPVMQIRADNIVGEADTAGAVRFSESRVGRARLERVTVRNRGLADTVAAAPAAAATPCHWKRNVPRLEACSITRLHCSGRLPNGGVQLASPKFDRWSSAARRPRVTL